jgi:signal peptidase II
VKSRRALVLLVAAIILIADRATKVWAAANLQVGQPEPVLGDFLRFNLIYNPGAAFSMLTNATWVFSIFATVASIAVIWYSRRIKSVPYAIAAGGVLAGASGNLIDRCINEPGFPVGHVTDFIELPYWPIFNVADSSIVVSMTCIVIMLLLGYNPDGTRETKTTANV